MDEHGKQGVWPQRLSSLTVPNSARFSRNVYLSLADMSIDSREQSVYLRVHLNVPKTDPFRVLCARLVRYAPYFNTQGTDLPRIGVSPGAWEFGGSPSRCHPVHGPFVVQAPCRFLGGCYLKGCQGYLWRSLASPSSLFSQSPFGTSTKY